MPASGAAFNPPPQMTQWVRIVEPSDSTTWSRCDLLHRRPQAEFDPEAEQDLGGVGMGLRRERAQDRVAEIDHDHPGLVDGEVVELRRQHVAHQFRRSPPPPRFRWRPPRRSRCSAHPSRRARGRGRHPRRWPAAATGGVRRHRVSTAGTRARRRAYRRSWPGSLRPGRCSRPANVPPSASATDRVDGSIEATSPILTLTLGCFRNS